MSFPQNPYIQYTAHSEFIQKYKNLYQSNALTLHDVKDLQESMTFRTNFSGKNIEKMITKIDYRQDDTSKFSKEITITWQKEIHMK